MRNHHDDTESTARSCIHRHAGGRWLWLAAGVFTLLSITVGGCDRGEPQTPEGEPPPGLPEPSPQPQQAEPPSQPAAPQAAPGDPASPNAPPAAQDPHASPQGEATGTQPAASISEAELETFAETQAELTTLRAKLVQEAQQAGDQAEMQKLQGQMQQGAAEIVQESELSVERYSEIATLVQKAPELQARLRGMMEQPGQ